MHIIRRVSLIAQVAKSTSVRVGHVDFPEIVDELGFNLLADRYPL